MKPSPKVEIKDPNAHPKAATKKLYNKPIIKQYGNVHALTKTVSNIAQADGGGGAMNRTH